MGNEMKLIVKNVAILIIINSLVLTSFFLYYTYSAPRAYDVTADFDLTYEDPLHDVEYYIDDEIQITENKDIDITQIRSYKSKNNKSLILELTVAGKIRKSEDYMYWIYLEKNGYDYYYISLQKGLCTGYYIDDEFHRNDILNYKIKNSNTLEINVPLEKLKDISEFNLYAEAYKDFEEDDFYIDDCYSFTWGEMINIMEPLEGSTVYETISIKGIADNYDEYLISSVEIQIETQSLTEWKLASTTDNWTTWIYQWNTSSLPDGKHTVYVRSFIDGIYYYDKIVVYTNQNSLTNRQSTPAPIYQIGDKYILQQKDLGLFPEDISTATSTWEIIDSGNIEINGTTYEIYINRITDENEYIDDYSHNKAEINGTHWIQKSNIIDLKSETKYNIHIKNDDGEYFQTIISNSTYEYSDGYNRYPLNVGNKWEKTVNITTREIIIRNGEIEYINYTEKIIRRYECLRVQNVTVPAGTFEVFLIYDRFNYSWASWMNVSENSSYNYYSNYDEYGIEYYSPEIGFTVKYENYYFDGELNSYWELVSYNYRNISFTAETVESSSKIPYKWNLSPLFITLFLTNSILLSTMFVTGTELGKYGFFKLFAPLLSKRKKKRNYELGFIKGSVRGVIYANPGENYSTIKKILDLPNGTLTYYLKALEKEKMIRSERDGFLKRFYPTVMKNDHETVELTEIQKEIYNTIKEKQGLSQKDIRTKLNITQQRLNYHIQLMVDARIIRLEKDGKLTRCYIIEENA
jgi:DNA-binding MarR family transcriptional regulator